MSFYNLPLLTADGGPSPALDNQTLTFIAGGSILLGDVVAFDTSLTGADVVATVVQAGTTATVGNARAFGFFFDPGGEFFGDIQVDVGVEAGPALGADFAAQGPLDFALGAVAEFGGYPLLGAAAHPVADVVAIDH